MLLPNQIILALPKKKNPNLPDHGDPPVLNQLTSNQVE